MEETEFIVLRTKTQIAVCEVEKGKVPRALRNGAQYMVRIDKHWDKLADPDIYRWTLALAKIECAKLAVAPLLKPRRFQTEREWLLEHQLGEKA